jgi:hypothetical protein
VHGSAVCLNEFTQDLAFYKFESGNESTKGLAQAVMTLSASGDLE